MSGQLSQPQLQSPPSSPLPPPPPSLSLSSSMKSIPIPEIVTQPIPSVGQAAPYWQGTAVVELTFEQLSIDQFKGKYFVLIFYQDDFSHVCPAELTAFSNRIEEFLSLGSDVIAVSTDSEFAHYAWIITPKRLGGLGEMRMPLLADKTHEISRRYGVLDENRGVSLKALFIIDDKQVVRFVSVSDTSLACSVDETLKAIRGCQFIDSTCPLDLKPSNECKEDDYFYVPSKHAA